MTKIAFFSAKEYEKRFFNQLNKDYHFTINYFSAPLDKNTARLARGYDVVCVFVNDIVDQKVASKLVDYGIKLIALRCAGFNSIDLSATSGLIKVVRVPEYSPFAVAEFTVGLMLSLNRKIHRSYLRSLEHNFSIDNLLGFDMHKKTVGIIGLGKIGKVVAEILKGFRMNILVHDINPDKEFIDEHNLALVDFDALLRESDTITLHCPLTDASHYMINEVAFSKMKQGVMLINTGRGGLINSKDLINNLKKQKIGSVALDVYEEESQYFHTNWSEQIIQDDIFVRLLTFPNVLITSHQAFFTKEALHNIAKTTLDSIHAFVLGKELKNEL